MRALLLAITLSSTALVSVAFAQTAGTTELRVGKLEKEMKAVQRTVFPNGIAVEPEIGSTATGASGTPASAPITDLTARVDALEAQLKTLTGQSEQDGFRIRKLEDGLKALRGETDARLKALEANAPAAPVETSSVTERPASVVATPTPPATKTSAVAKPAPTKPAAPAKPVSPAKIDPQRKSLVAAIDVPATGDAAEDAYAYGYRLWSSKFYPEAQVKLKEFMAKFATHKRASFAQNLLGRAYLDEGKPALASVAFYDNYQKNPRGDRASESLYWLGISLTKLKKLGDACKVYSEFSEVYGASASSDLKARVAKGRTNANCTA